MITVELDWFIGAGKIASVFWEEINELLAPSLKNLGYSLPQNIKNYPFLFYMLGEDVISNFLLEEK